MIMEDEMGENIRLRWLSSLFELSHIQFQRKVWFGLIEKYACSYTEAVCRYYDDLDLENDLKSFMEEGFINKTEYEIVNQFHKDLTSYIKKQENKDVVEGNLVNDRTWIGLMDEGEKMWLMLKATITNEREIACVHELEKHIYNYG